MLVINAFVFHLKVGLETPKREHKGEKFLKKNFTASRDGPVKKDRNKAGMRTQEHYPTTE